jgi:hypothetical protein
MRFAFTSPSPSLLAASLIAFAPLPVPAVEIHYSPVVISIIESRLRTAPDTNKTRARTVRELFEDAGCSGDHLSEQAVKHVKSPNLICSLDDTLSRTIIIGAHFDFIERGKGVVDNWSGASLLSSLYEALKSSPRRHRFLFVAFTEEEKGMIGSAFYVKQMSPADVANTSAVVNLDSLGTSPTKLEITRGDQTLIRALNDVARTVNLPVDAVDVHRVGRSDSDSFQDRKIPTINIHSVTQATLPILHSARDRFEAIHMDEYYDTYKLLAAYLAYLDEKLDPSTTEQKP